MSWINTIHKTQDISGCTLFFLNGKMTKETHLRCALYGFLQMALRV